jgi:hypothetical protein
MFRIVEMRPPVRAGLAIEVVGSLMALYQLLAIALWSQADRFPDNRCRFTRNGGGGRHRLLNSSESSDAH